MKKKILSILPSMLFMAMFVQAQTPVATTYRGAFAPAPVAQWTDNWTNWNPQVTSYGTGLPVATKTGVIGSATQTSVSWVKDSVYLLQGIVFVDSLVTLTIEPGTIIKGDATTVGAALIIQRGAKIIANGTPCNPIVFTSSKAANAPRLKGDWGGVILLGRAQNNVSNDFPIEGIGTTNPRGRHGGTVNNDNSGILKYVRIEYAGYVLSANNEINSLTMGSVGTGTTIDYVQTSFGNDDAFEWFGGSVNCAHLVSYRNLDDDFDTDNGFSGLIQFGLAVRDPQIADVPAISTSEGFESDNNAGGTAAAPKTTAKFYNITQIGAFRCGTNAGGITQPTADGFRRGARIRRLSELKIFNSIFMNNWRGLLVDAPTLALNQQVFQNNIIAMDLTTAWVAPYAGAALAGEDAGTTTFLNAGANTIVTTPCNVLTNAWDFLNPDYRPNPVGSGAALSGCDLTPGISIETALFNPSTVTTAQELVVDIFENAVGNSNGTITVNIPVPPSFIVAVNGLASLPTSLATAAGGNAGTSTNLGAPYDNTAANWKFYNSGSALNPVITAVSQSGFTVPLGGQVSLGFTIKRKTAVPAGTNQSLNVGVSGGADTNGTNDGALNGVGTTN
jgi:hypothetical protein